MRRATPERRVGVVVQSDAPQRRTAGSTVIEQTLLVRACPDETLLRRADPARAADARSRLLAAILHLLETRDADILTVDVMVREAQLSRTTFYRLFEDREGALHAAADRMLVELLATLPRLDGPLGDAERTRLRAWIKGLLDALLRRSRAWCSADERWRRRVIAELETYIGRLREARLVRCDAPRTVATGVVYLLDGVLAPALLAKRNAFDGSCRAIVADVAERIVFGT